MKEERKNAMGAGDTFSPQLIPRVGGAAGNAKGTDSLDRLANQVSNVNDPMEMPLPGQKGKAQPIVDQQPPSPSSDALGKEIKRFGGNQGSAPGNPAPKGKYLQQFDSGPKLPEDDQAFASMLRSDGTDKRDSRPGWNDDTVSSGFAAPPRRSLGRMKSEGEKKPARPSAFRAPANNLERGYSDNYQPEEPQVRKLSPRASSFNNGSYSNENINNGTRVSPRNDMVKGQLSLLKSKLRQSESAGVSRSNKSSASSIPDSDYDMGRRTAPDDAYQYNPARERRAGGGIATESSAPANPRKGRDMVFEEPVRRANPEPAPARRNAEQPPQRAAPNRAPAPAPAPARGNQSSSNPFDNAPVPAIASKASNSIYDQPLEDEYEPAEVAMEGEQQQCPDCGRKFNPIPYSKHVKICQKVFQKQRKVFDSKLMRIGDDKELLKLNAQAQKEEAKERAKAKKQQAQAQGQGQRPAQQEENFFPAKKTENQPIKSEGGDKAKWKAESDAFRAAMKAARQYNEAKATGKPLPPPVASAPDNSLIPCPHCGRRFNEKAAERHIPQCQNIKAKPSSLKRGTGMGIGSTVAAPKGRGGR